MCALNNKYINSEQRKIKYCIYRLTQKLNYCAKRTNTVNLSKKKKYEEKFEFLKLKKHILMQRLLEQGIKYGKQYT